MDIIGTKAGLLAAMADGQEHNGWDFAAGTLGWAKREGLVAPGRTVAPILYTITERGRKLAAMVAKSKFVTKSKLNSYVLRCLDIVCDEEDMATLVDYADGGVQS